MSDELRDRAVAVLDASAPGRAGGAFFADIAWSELLETASGVPRLQLGALLTRRPPGRLAPDATGADVAEVLDGYRADILHANRNSGSGDTAARFDASLAALRQLGPLADATPTTPAPAPTPAGPPAAPTPAAESPAGRPPVPGTTAAAPPAPRAPVDALTTAPPAPTPAATPQASAGSATTWPGTPVTPDPADAARRAELTRVATALGAVVQRAHRTAMQHGRTTSRPQPPPVPHPRPTPRPTGTARPSKPEPKLWFRFVRATFILLLAHQVVNIVLDDSSAHNWYLLAVIMVVALAPQVSHKSTRTTRLLFAALPGASLTIAALQWRYDLPVLAYATVLAFGIVMNLVYFIAAIRMSWRSPQQRPR